MINLQWNPEKKIIVSQISLLVIVLFFLCCKNASNSESLNNQDSINVQIPSYYKKIDYHNYLKMKEVKLFDSTPTSELYIDKETSNFLVVTTNKEFDFNIPSDSVQKTLREEFTNLKILFQGEKFIIYQSKSNEQKPSDSPFCENTNHCQSYHITIVGKKSNVYVGLNYFENNKNMKKLHDFQNIAAKFYK
ncbi:hypothetical protein [Flavobacterium sp.]|uniref:hypothetical protein n=1 Tax=Flavobacterium sp. TaxID=239 RepID=UPI00262D49F8|nr:hypothetical protein [Flavobacterium sp.]